MNKALALFKGFLRRIKALLTVGKYNFIFIHRESTPVGPPVIEWILAKVLGKRIIYDFDDAIWIANSSESNRFFAPLKFHGSLFSICRWSYKISAGNEYLKNAVLPYNEKVIVNPTTIDTVNLHNILASHDNELTVIGWTGSHSTNKYLNSIVDVIRRLKEKHQFKLMVISDEAPSIDAELIEFVKWNKEHEIEDLLKINIGIMPLTHDPWSEGKCGFKALQYMSLGIPAVVSPVGINEEIVDDGINGYICHNEQEWFDKLSYLIENRRIIKSLGLAARNKIEAQFSVDSNTSNFINLFT